MPFATPHPLEDDAWRVSDALPGVAHFYGWSSDYDGHPKCGAAGLPAQRARQAADGDALCADCEGWYWLNVSMPWLA